MQNVKESQFSPGNQQLFCDMFAFGLKLLLKDKLMRTAFIPIYIQTHTHIHQKTKLNWKSETGILKLKL